MNHIMLDLETLDTATTGVIVSIGAVRFDPATGELGPTFYVVLNRQQQLNAGRTVSASTIDWWMQQDDKARSVFGGLEFMPVEALERFAGFVDSCFGCDGLWGNGSDFDNAMLASLYRTFGIKQPWSHKANRCYRTMVAALSAQLPEGGPALIRSGTHHNALDDARTQAKHLMHLMRLANLRCSTSRRWGNDAFPEAAGGAPPTV